jgi:ribonuclease P protein component
VLAKKYRLTGEREFKKIYTEGKYLNGKLVTIKYLYSFNQISPKIGIVVSKKISNKAFVRNKIKRQISEIVYNSFQKISKKIKMIIIAKKIPDNFQALKIEINQLLKHV